MVYLCSLLLGSLSCVWHSRPGESKSLPALFCHHVSFWLSPGSGLTFQATRVLLLLNFSTRCLYFFSTEALLTNAGRVRAKKNIAVKHGAANQELLNLLCFPLTYGENLFTVSLLYRAR